MTDKSKIFFSLALLTIIFNFFFWQEKLGLNIFIFILLTAIAASLLNKDSYKNNKVTALFFAVLCSGAMVLYSNSGFSKFGFITSFIVLTGFIHQPQLRTIASSILTSLGSFVIFPYNFLEEIRLAQNKYKSLARTFKIIRLAVIPLAVFSMFYGIYAYANPIFNNYSVSFWDSIGIFFNNLLINYPPERIIMICFGVFLITGVLFNRNIKVFLKIDLSYLNNLIRDKYRKLITRTDDRYEIGKKAKGIFPYKMFSLMTENKIGVILLVMVNLLLLILNIIDISFVWIGFDSSQVENLAYFVHEGTYYLIFSIVLSMVILLYFFRGNLNFYSKNKLLKYGAYFWIFQNVIMAVSVALRNYYYIDYYYALSYKRIGVMIFLMLTFIGLATMFYKIYERKTLFFLIKANSLAAFIVMILMGSVNWDEQIARFNLQNPNRNEIDAGYLLTLSDAVLPLLNENKDILDKEMSVNEGFREYLSDGTAIFKARKKAFIDEQKSYTWLSWNYSDKKINEYFENHIERQLVQ